MRQSPPRSGTATRAAAATPPPRPGPTPRPTPRTAPANPPTPRTAPRRSPRAPAPDGATCAATTRTCSAPSPPPRETARASGRFARTETRSPATPPPNGEPSPASLCPSMISFVENDEGNGKITRGTITAQNARLRMDRRIGRLLRVLPPDLGQPIALECVSHKRKSRRTAGLKGLKLHAVDEVVTRFMMNCFDRTNDERIIKVLLQHPLRIRLVDPARLLRIFHNDEYWQMRTIEAALRTDKNAGSRFSKTHPAQFIWAAGRVGDQKLIPEILDCFESENDKLSIIGIVSWAYGKLRAHSELEAIVPLLNEFEQQYKLRSE